MAGRRDWRYIAERLNGDGTSTFLDFNVPLRNVEIEDSLSSPNSFSATISPELGNLKDSDGRPLFEEHSTAIYAEKDGEIRGGGILAHSGFEGPEWSLECTGFVGYAKDTPYTGDGIFYINTDTLDIFRAIWGHIQSQNGSNIGLTFDTQDSGRLIGSELTASEYDPEGGSDGLTLETQAYKLAWYQDHDLLSNLTGLSEESPFDFTERHYWSGDTITHRVDFGVPAIGTRRNDLRFVIGENVFIKPQVERAGDDYADEVYVLGAGEGAKMIRGHAITSRNRLRRVAVITDSSIRSLSKANAVAAAELRWRMSLDDFSGIIVRDHKHADIGSVSVGDEIRVQGRTGWVDVDAWYRVINRTIRPSEAGAMELGLVRSDRLAG